MILELVGLPGAGKSTLASALVEAGVSRPLTVSRRGLVLWALFGVMLHPLAALEVTFRVAKKGKGMLRYGFINAVLYPFAATAKSLFSAVHIEHGFMQGLIGFPSDDIAKTLALLPKPSAVVILETSKEARQNRLHSRGWKPREEFGAEVYRNFEASSEKLFPVVQGALKEYWPRQTVVVSGEFAPQRQVKQLTLALAARRSFTQQSLKKITYVLAFIFNFFGSKKDSGAVVLMYHAVDHSGYVLSVPPKVFEQQMAYLASRMRAVKLSDIVMRHKNKTLYERGGVALTFDDGYADLRTTVLPILQKYKIPATVFVPTDILVATDPLETPRMDWDDMRALMKSNLISFESHGKAHRRMASLPEEELSEEARESAKVIEKELGRAPRFFAYPFGERSNAAERAVQSAGYEAAFGITQGTVDSSKDIFALNRVQVDATTTPFLFKVRLTRAVTTQNKIMGIIRKLFSV